MSEMKTSEVLDLAADEIEGAGWSIGHGWENNGDGLCLEGGLLAAMGLQIDVNNASAYAEFQMCPAYVAVREYLDLLPGRALYAWNDSQDRADTVISTLRGAAAAERAKEESLEDSVSKEEVSA